VSGPLAAVDCGTNSTRLLVVDDGGTVLAREMRITRLGEGVDATKLLSLDGIDRTLSVLADYRDVLDRHAVSKTRVVATSAVRDAGNAEEFMGAATALMGVAPEVLSGEEEGRLSFLGATAHLPADFEGRSGLALVVDIGGGSTELSVGEPAAIASTPPRPVCTVSLDFGCVRVTERFLQHDPPLWDELARARAQVEAAVRSARAELPAVEPGGAVIGLAGTVSTVASLERAVPAYDRNLLHHAEMSRAVVERWLDALAAEDSATRLTRPGMEEGREDVIVGGVVILAVVMEVFECDRCVYSEDDILDGLVISLRPGPSAAVDAS
jgi:exopolyphosphatase/guanosine-5'-triphosphate,3'-diphosphate pyrophosphatase